MSAPCREWIVDVVGSCPFELLDFQASSSSWKINWWQVLVLEKSHRETFDFVCVTKDSDKSKKKKCNYKMNGRKQAACRRDFWPATAAHGNLFNIFPTIFKCSSLLLLDLTHPLSKISLAWLSSAFYEVADADHTAAANNRTLIDPVSLEPQSHTSTMMKLHADRIKRMAVSIGCRVWHFMRLCAAMVIIVCTPESETHDLPSIQERFSLFIALDIVRTSFTVFTPLI